MKGFPAPLRSKLKLPSGRKVALITALAIFPASSLGVVFLCVFLLTSPGKQALRGGGLKKKVYAFFASKPPVLGVSSERHIPAEARGEIINQYFALQNAPLSGYGEKFVQVAEKYDLPWTLLPAIAMQESNGGKKIPHGTYNAWGWGITASETLGFTDWETAIETVGRGLRRNYFDQGLTTPEKIMARYCPLSLAKGGSWAKGVEYFQLELASF